jgi:hypothetical protein
VHEPANVDSKLLRFGSRQEVTVVQRMQEAGFGDPAALFDDDAVHHGDLSGWTAEAEQCNAQPNLERFGEADAMRRRALIGGERCARRGARAHARPPAIGVGQLWVSLAASRAQR